MGNDCITAKDDLNVVTTNQFGDVATCSCMDDSRTEHEENLPVTPACLFHLARNFVYCEYLHLLGGDGALHKCKRFAISSTFEWLDANTSKSDHYLFTDLHFVHWFAVSTMSGFINDNRDIHFDIFYLYP